MEAGVRCGGLGGGEDEAEAVKAMERRAAGRMAASCYPVCHDRSKQERKEEREKEKRGRRRMGTRHGQKCPEGQIMKCLSKFVANNLVQRKLMQMIEATSKVGQMIDSPNKFIVLSQMNVI